MRIAVMGSGDLGGQFGARRSLFLLDVMREVVALGRAMGVAP